MPEFTNPGAAVVLPSMPVLSGFSSMDVFRALQVEETAQRMATQAQLDPVVAMYLSMSSGLQVTNYQSALRAARPLAQDAQTEFDAIIVQVGQERLAVFAELLNRNLTKPLSNWLARRTMQWDSANEYGNAIEFMDPSTDFPNAQRDLQPNTIPIPGIMEGARFGIRELLQSRATGDPLDTDKIRMANINVNLAVEDRCVNGGGVSVDGIEAFGFLNHPDAASVAYTGGLSWTNVGHTPQHKIDDVRNMIQELRNRRRNGPYVLALEPDYEHEISDDIDDTRPSEGTIRDRLERLVNAGQPLTIVSTDALPTDRTFLFQPSVDVVDAIVGQEPTATSWTVPPGWESWCVVMACLITRIKVDALGFVGVCTGDLT